MSRFWENNKTKQYFWTKKPEVTQWSSDADASFYHTTAWRKCRKAYIQAHPQCAVCYGAKKLQRADVVDHITPIRAGGSELDWSNLQSLCHKCHNRKSAKERHEYSQINIQPNNK